MRTQFDQSHKDFSDTAHNAARTVIYPKIFGTDSLRFETCDLKDNEHSRILDGEMAVDRLVYVTVVSLQAPLKFTVQERFRKPEYYKWQDVTITEWNKNSNLPSELYKINAGLFVYGYFDQSKGLFLDAICVNVTELLLKIVRCEVKYDSRINPKNQTFFGFRFKDLHTAGLVSWRLHA